MQRSAVEKPVIARNGATSGPFSTAWVCSTVFFCTSMVAEQPTSAPLIATMSPARRRIDGIAVFRAARCLSALLAALARDRVARVRRGYGAFARRGAGLAAGAADPDSPRPCPGTLLLTGV